MSQAKARKGEIERQGEGNREGERERKRRGLTPIMNGDTYSVADCTEYRIVLNSRQNKLATLLVTVPIFYTIEINLNGIDYIFLNTIFPLLL